MVIMGVDPGLDGGIAFIKDSGEIMHYQKMPTRVVLDNDCNKTNKRIIDIAQIAAMIAKMEPEHAFIEKVHAMPKQGVSSTFTFGVGYGMVLGLCLSLEAIITTQLIPPQRWQKFMYASMHKDDSPPKKRAMARFYEIWPEMIEANVTHDGIIDAMLIAEYGRRTLNLN
jgi:hypothetical protein